MTDSIYLIQGESDLVEMSQAAYDSEALLQTLIAKYPNVMAGDQMNPSNPRRWLLVVREMGVPEELDGSNRWSLDHLFLDQDAIPTLVEVKRSSDTRIRREVVGQMLDYAANAVVYWPVEEIKSRFETRCTLDGEDHAEVLSEFIGDEDGSEEEFWQKAKTNLQAGRVRLVFVADQIPPTLQRIVEFLNGQMDPAEVLAVELKQFQGEGMRTLVPRVVGQTAISQAKKAPSVISDDKLLQREFLTEFAKYVSQSEASWPIKPPSKPKAARIKVPNKQGLPLRVFAGFEDHLGNTPGKRIENIRVEIGFRKKIIGQYKQLRKTYDQLQSQLGSDLLKSNNPQETVGRFYKIKNVELANQEEWQNHFEWLVHELANFEKGFASALSSIEDS